MAEVGIDFDFDELGAVGEACVFRTFGRGARLVGSVISVRSWRRMMSATLSERAGSLLLGRRPPSISTSSMMTPRLDGFVPDMHDGVAEVFDWYFHWGDVEFNTGGSDPMTG